jgi:hypothetical protein
LGRKENGKNKAGWKERISEFFGKKSYFEAPTIF